VTLPTPDAQSPDFLSDYSHSIAVAHSMPAPIPSAYAHSSVPPSLLHLHNTGLSGEIVDDSAADSTDRSWDLVTGGLKALTAKRELPSRLDRRPSGNLQENLPAPRSYTLALVLLVCFVVMLISGGVVLFMMVQP